MSVKVKGLLNTLFNATILILFLKGKIFLFWLDIKLIIYLIIFVSTHELFFLVEKFTPKKYIQIIFF